MAAKSVVPAGTSSADPCCVSKNPDSSKLACQSFKIALVTLKTLFVGSVAGFLLAEGAITLMTIGATAAIGSLTGGIILGIAFIGLSIYLGSAFYDEYSKSKKSEG